MKIAIIGTQKYARDMAGHARARTALGDTVTLPVFDNCPEFNELQLCQYNLKNIKWADVVHVFWDNRSPGTIFDFAMAFALGKKVRIVYMEPKPFQNVMEMYEETFK